MDQNDEPSRIQITDPKAEKVLTSVLNKSVFIRSHQYYVHGKNTFYVESFNNTMNSFHYKRTAYGTKQYQYRSEITTMYLNENVDIDYTSVWNDRCNITKSPTYKYNYKVWDKYIASTVRQ